MGADSIPISLTIFAEIMGSQLLIIGLVSIILLATLVFGRSRFLEKNDLKSVIHIFIAILNGQVIAIAISCVYFYGQLDWQVWPAADVILVSLSRLNIPVLSLSPGFGFILTIFLLFVNPGTRILIKRISLFPENVTRAFVLLVMASLALLIFTYIWSVMVTEFGSYNGTHVVELVSAIESRSMKSWYLAWLILCVPIIEEMVFRGVVFYELFSRFGIRHAILIQGVIFSAVHTDLVQAIPLFLIGVVLAWVYYKTNSILAPAIIHASISTAALLPAIGSML